MDLPTAGELRYFTNGELLDQLRNVARRLSDLRVRPDHPHINQVLTIEARRPGTHHVTANPVSHVTIDGLPSRDWPANVPPVAPEDVYRLLGDNRLCVALAQVNLHMDRVNHTDILTISHNVTMVLRYQFAQERTIFLPLRLKEADEAGSDDDIDVPIDVPTLDDYIFPGATAKTWRVRASHFPRPTVSGVISAAQMDAEDNEITHNKELLEYWKESGVEDIVLDPVPLRLFTDECKRILKTAKQSLSDPVISSMNFTTSMSPPIRNDGRPPPAQRARII